MRKLKLQMQMSVDGFVAGANGEMDWMVFDWGEDIKEHVAQITGPVDTIIIGRKLAVGFIPTWSSMLANPETADAFAKKMVETPKIVFSKTLAESEWMNTKLAKDDLIEEVTQLKNQPGGDIIVYGGGTFVSALIKAALVDGFHLFVNPVILGDGMTIFKDIESKQNLTLIASKSFQCGITALTYELNRNSLGGAQT